jgi:hypothetical protein
MAAHKYQAPKCHKRRTGHIAYGTDNYGKSIEKHSADQIYQTRLPVEKSNAASFSDITDSPKSLKNIIISTIITRVPP